MSDKRGEQLVNDSGSSRICDICACSKLSLSCSLYNAICNEYVSKLLWNYKNRPIKSYFLVDGKLSDEFVKIFFSSGLSTYHMICCVFDVDELFMKINRPWSSSMCREGIEFH